jgi:hypothetical protein
VLTLTRDGSPEMSASAPPAASAPRDPKIKPRHLALRVIIYVRQSSPTRAQRHQEGARRQYHLAERALLLGWATDEITIIDGDLGKSGAGSAAAHDRTGFAQQVTAVGQGEDQADLALEVSRLARNSAEWCRLLDLAALAGALIGVEGQFDEWLVVRGSIATLLTGLLLTWLGRWGLVNAGSPAWAPVGAALFLAMTPLVIWVYVPRGRAFGPAFQTAAARSSARPPSCAALSDAANRLCPLYEYAMLPVVIALMAMKLF